MRQPSRSFSDGKASARSQETAINGTRSGPKTDGEADGNAMNDATKSDTKSEAESQAAKTLKRHRTWTRALLIALPIFTAGAAGCARSGATPAQSDDAEAPIAVKLVAAEVVKAPRVVTLSGSLIGAEQAEVAAGAAGKVVASYVERGSFVKKGSILARLDSR